MNCYIVDAMNCCIVDTMNCYIVDAMNYDEINSSRITNKCSILYFLSRILYKAYMSQCYYFAICMGFSPKFL